MDGLIQKGGELNRKNEKSISIISQNDNIIDRDEKPRAERKKQDFATLKQRHNDNTGAANNLGCYNLHNCLHQQSRPDLYNVTTSCSCSSDIIGAHSPVDRDIIANSSDAALSKIQQNIILSLEEKIINNQDEKSATPTNSNDYDNNNEVSTSNVSNKAATNNPKPFSRSRLSTLAQIGEDWLYLASLGAIMAVISFSMDSVIQMFFNNRLWLFRDLNENNLFVQYSAWCLPPIILVAFSTGFVHLCSPTAIGSGIPEMKTILRGVILNEYLTFRTLIAKIVGLTCTLGSGLPLGKEGPFVHMASIVATLLSKLVASFQGIYENESRSSEMLSAACAVGVAATFYAPIGGVLFSIEVTTVYFAVRNYWRGFFAACCGATIWRLMGFWIKNDESISALFRTYFRTEYPFDPIELIVFSFIGASCGLFAAAYIKFHREIVHFFRRHEELNKFFQRKLLISAKHSQFVYPILVTSLITTVTFPPFLGRYTAATLSTHQTIDQLFSNRTWSLGSQDLVSKNILDEWTTPETNFQFHLVLYILMLFWTSALASTIPIPSGLFIPVLKMGAAYGRLLGELMHMIFPDGIKYGDYVHTSSIVPGSYAVVGAAALSGAVTHTISTSVILFEMTGQIVHIIPVILGVLISNAVCQSLQPSIYDSIIEIKKLPYLPPIASNDSFSHKILVKDFMNTKLAYVWKHKCSYADLKNLLMKNRKIFSFPLVDSSESMKLLGSVSRPDLLKLLYIHLGPERRLQEVCRHSNNHDHNLFSTLSSDNIILDNSSLDQRDLVSQLTLRNNNQSTTSFGQYCSEQLQLSQVSKSQAASSSPKSILKTTHSANNLQKRGFASRSSLYKRFSFVDANNSANNMRSVNNHIAGNYNYNISTAATSLSTSPMTAVVDQQPQLQQSHATGNGDHQWGQQNANVTFELSLDANQENSTNSGEKAADEQQLQQKACCGAIIKPIRKVRLPCLRVVDMTPMEQAAWENEQLQAFIDLSRCPIDEAPFQLVEQTSLYRVHTLFSMLGLNHAYVTSFGRLVGVVALKDIRVAIEKVMQEN